MFLWILWGDTGGITKTLRLRQGLELKIEDDLVNGDGTLGALSGLLKTGNFTAFTPTLGDTAIDSLRKAKLALETADYRAGLILMHPTDGDMARPARFERATAWFVGSNAFAEKRGRINNIARATPLFRTIDNARKPLIHKERSQRLGGIFGGSAVLIAIAAVQHAKR